MLESSEQTEQLLRAITGIGAHLDTHSTLKSVITEAMKLTGCRYGAVATRDADENLTAFVHSGRGTDTPTGKGLIGVVWRQSSPIRLDDLSAHPAAAQAPEDFPDMRAFLGVPITLQGNVFSGLYLTDDRPGWVFSESHEVAVRIFASAAAVAIDNARLFERSERRADWLLSSRGVITELLLGAQSTRLPLQLIATELQKLSHAEQAIVLTPSDADLPPEEIETLIVSAAVGVHADEVIGQEIPVDRSTTGHVFRTGEALITESFRYPIPAFTDAGERSAIVMPLRYERTVKGVIAVARGRSETPFDSSYLDLVGDFASHAALALALAAKGENSRELSILADRERIAHDLHDYVIQRLFAIGLDVQGTIARVRSPELVARLDRTIDDLQTTIEDIRNTIFQLQTPATGDGGFRRKIQQTVADLTENREITTTLHMSGPMTAVDSQLAQHAEAVVAEAVSNAVRHSGAKHLNIKIAVADDLCIDVVDDGCGIPEKNQRRSGLANLQRRAEQVGGVCAISTPATGGTAIHWAAPLVD
ncbi:GAF domain-containing protein [Mycobacterium paraterrae]|uniref:sensor histidine kinase n=1 Tax=Mycobacterium paraterrae TaxID=577492 RepID=UPI003D9C82B6